MDTPGRRRQVLKETLGQYISDTLSSIHTINDFFEKKEKWSLQREREVDMIRDIKGRADKISLTFDHVQTSEDKAKAFGEFLWSGLTAVTADSRRQELEKELGAVLKDTLEGLEKLQRFLEAVEKLSVTSLFVFTNGHYLPRGLSAVDVRSVIFAARMAAPLLVHFKRDDAAFFLPSLSNVEVLAFYLEKYKDISEQLCEKLEKRAKSISTVGSSYRGPNCGQTINFSADTNEESIQKMLDHLNQLNLIRTNKDLRLTFLFQEDALPFIGLFSQRSTRMLQFLSDLEESARQLDNMKFGASVSNVAGSSVGLAGGVVSIIGLALAPVTAGVSLILTLTGVGLGVTSGVNSLVTGITEMAVNKHHGTNASNIFQSFMEDVKQFVDHLELVASNEGSTIGFDVLDIAVGAGKALASTCGIAKSVDALVDASSAVKVLQTEEVVASAVKLGFQAPKSGRNIPKLASDLPDIGQLAKGTPLALSKSARSGFIALNALFIGLDVFFICKDSVSLAKGSKNEVAQLIRSRDALWRTELDSWEKIRDSLCRGIWRFRRSQRILEQPFYPEQTS
ncbi:apolipoprotein L2-like [Clupea harengus]|uniref:Apolipoprotein L2-like n=1 Tax=Clupea harengus TaxID=7950 RepID=A0A6P8EZR1_CLUHA|nr:apolipoprotein L2-like [Clupea harengus]